MALVRGRRHRRRHQNGLFVFTLLFFFFSLHCTRGGQPLSYTFLPSQKVFQKVFFFIFLCFVPFRPVIPYTATAGLAYENKKYVFLLYYFQAPFDFNAILPRHSH